MDQLLVTDYYFGRRPADRYFHGVDPVHRGVVNARQSQVTEDLKGEGEARTQGILEEVRALGCEIEAPHERFAR